MTINEFFKKYCLPIIGSIALTIISIFLFGRLDRISDELLIIKEDLGSVKASVEILTSSTALSTGYAMDHESKIGMLKATQSSIENRVDKLENKVFQ